MRSLFVAVLVSASLGISSSGLAQAPDSLSFQGFVTAPGGLPIDTSGVSMIFKLYEGSSEIWSETQPSVEVVAGIFNVLLGSVTPLDTVRFDRPLLLGIKVGADAEISPRTPMAAAAYAKALPGLYTFYGDNGSIRSHNVVGGASNNVVGPGVVGATIGGGGGLGLSGLFPNKVLASFGTIGGGRKNVASGVEATVGGGEGNTASGKQATVSGGFGNTASGANWRMTVGGGGVNTASGWLATVSGGGENTASGTGSTVGGGLRNTAGGGSAAIGGGEDNTANGTSSTVPGGSQNKANGLASFAAGSKAQALHEGTFVWNGYVLSGDPLVSTGNRQFLIGAPGGVGIGTNSPAGELHIATGLSGDTEVLIEADPDNDNDGDNPILRFRQDGGLNGMNIGFDDASFGADVFGIAARVSGVDKSSTFVIEPDGDIGSGTSSPGSNRLKINNIDNGGISGSTVHVENSSSGSGIAGVFVSNGTDATLVVDNNSTGDLIRAFTGGLRFAVRNNGDVNADGSFTSPAMDLAEVFEVDGPTSNYEPGDVLVISTQNNRTVELSSLPVSNLVVGVYATKPGVQLGTPIEGRTVPMGVVGVLPTKVTSENGPIKRGDFLVTSSTPGHAMRAEPVVVGGIEIYPTGAILGKALEPFDGAETGVATGVIEVLVGVH